MKPELKEWVWFGEEEPNWLDFLFTILIYLFGFVALPLAVLGLSSAEVGVYIRQFIS